MKARTIQIKNHLIDFTNVVYINKSTDAKSNERNRTCIDYLRIVFDHTPEELIIEFIDEFELKNQYRKLLRLLGDDD